MAEAREVVGEGGLDDVVDVGDLPLQGCALPDVALESYEVNLKASVRKVNSSTSPQPRGENANVNTQAQRAYAKISTQERRANVKISTQAQRANANMMFASLVS